MGVLFSRRRPRTSKEILEDLDKQIPFLTQRRQRSQEHEKSFIGFLLILSFFFYLVGALIFYLYFLPKTWLEGAVNSLPLLLFPFVVYLVKKLLNMYFHHQKSQYDQQLSALYEEKRRVLNEVMEKETYNTARELLERFDPSHPSLRTNPTTQGRQRRQNASNGSEVRQRRAPQTPHPALMRRPAAMATPQTVPPAMRGGNLPVTMSTPAPPPTTMSQPQVPAEPTALAGVAMPQYIPPGMCLGPAPGPPTPSPILPRERSSMDKVVEYLVGDGPNNRFALICSECHSHNGMVLRDEFEYITFRCAYCYHLNPARKRKPSLLPPSAPPTTRPPENLEPNNTQDLPADMEPADTEPADTEPADIEPSEGDVGAHTQRNHHSNSEENQQ